MTKRQICFLGGVTLVLLMVVAGGNAFAVVQCDNYTYDVTNKWWEYEYSVENPFDSGELLFSFELEMLGAWVPPGDAAEIPDPFGVPDWFG